MEVYSGQSILSRITYGPLRIYQREAPPVKRATHRSAAEEWQRFCVARDEAMEQLHHLYSRALRDVGDAVASIFSAHASLLEDDEFADRISLILRAHPVTAEYAVKRAASDLSVEFSNMDSSYIKAREADIRDVACQVIRRLTHRSAPEVMRGGPAILASDELFPSELMAIPHENLLGVVCRSGSVYSHTSMLLRCLDIPGLALMGVSGVLREGMALLDGVEGKLYLDPDHDLLENYHIAPERGVGNGVLLPLG